MTETVPDGYVSDDAVKEISVDTESTCADGDEEAATFVNTPLTDVTVSVDSQVDGGTSTTITCGTEEVVTDPQAPDNGDGSLSLTDLEPGTVNCAIVIDP